MTNTLLNGEKHCFSFKIRIRQRNPMFTTSQTGTNVLLREKVRKTRKERQPSQNTAVKIPLFSDIMSLHIVNLKYFIKKY